MRTTLIITGVFTTSAVVSAALSVAAARIVWRRAYARTCHTIPAPRVGHHQRGQSWTPHSST